MSDSHLKALVRIAQDPNSTTKAREAAKQELKQIRIRFGSTKESRLASGETR